MKKFLNEFKAFIMRGNVVDMAVGVIIGGAFTAIVTALTNQIFMPLVNWALAALTGGEGMAGAVTMLKEVKVDGVVDMTQSIYIDWGAFITAILNFIIIAFILFSIIKMINALHEAGKPNFFGYSKSEYKALRKSGKSREDIKALADERDRDLAFKKAQEDAAAAAKAAEPTATEKLLSEILETLKNK